MSTTTNTAEAVLAALEAGPADAAAIAERAGIGRSTAGKALVALAARGAVQRSPGGRDGARRLPDTWSLPAPRDAQPGTAEPAAEAPAAVGEPRPESPLGRLAKGELRTLVLAFLREHPGEHTPTTVARALAGRSSGAVGNALAKLADAGEAVQTSPAPRRYRAAS